MHLNWSLNYITFSAFHCSSFQWIMQFSLLSPLCANLQMFKQCFTLFFQSSIIDTKCNLRFGKSGLQRCYDIYAQHLLRPAANSFIQHWADLNLGVGAEEEESFAKLMLKSKVSTVYSSLSFWAQIWAAACYWDWINDLVCKIRLSLKNLANLNDLDGFPIECLCC